MDAAAEWAHRAFVAADEAHMNSPAEEYSKAFVEMRGGIKARKDGQLPHAHYTRWYSNQGGDGEKSQG